MPFYTLPPKQKHAQVESQLVTAWGKEFDIGSIAQSDVTVLRDASTSDAGFVSMDTEMREDKGDDWMGQLMEEEDEMMEDGDGEEDMMSNGDDEDDDAEDDKVEMLL